MPATLAPTPFVDSDHPAVRAFADRHAHSADERERAVAQLYAEGDDFHYDSYRSGLSHEGIRAGHVLATDHGWWYYPKATLLAAVRRAAGILARLGYADVRDHLSTERMPQTMQTDLFVWHGSADVWLDGA